MAFPSGFLDEIKARLPVSAVVGKRVRLAKAGKEWRGLSPFNAEKSPSFFVNDQKQRWFDFSSGRNGDVFAFVMETEGVDFIEAVTRLAGEAGLALPEVSPEAKVQERRRRDIAATLAAAQEIYRAGLAAAPAALDWLAGRGVAPDSIARFEIGHAPADGREFLRAMRGGGFDDEALVAAGLLVAPEGDRAPYARFRDRITFPIHDGAGRLVSFGGRALVVDEKTPKYLNGPESAAFDKGATLFNLHRARPVAHQSGRLALVEGYLDVVLMDQAGWQDVVAPLGTAITEAHLETAWRAAPEPIVMLDGDAAGRKAAVRLVDIAWPRLESTRSLVFAALARARDPADLVVRACGLARRWSVRSGAADPGEIEKTARAWALGALDRVASAGRPFVEIAWEHLLDEAGPLDRPERKARLAKLVRERIEAIADADAAEAYRGEFNTRMRVAKVPAHLKVIEGGKGKTPAKGAKSKRGRDGDESDEEAGKVAASSWGYDTGKLNAEWALVLIGSKAVIVREQPKAPVEDRLRILSLDAFRAKYLNKVTQVLGSDGKLRTVTWADRWLRDKERRSFDGIEFHPDAENGPGTTGYLNLWRGFSVTPRKGAGTYAIFRDHLVTNICGGDVKRFTWLWAWFAHLLQRPRERIGTAIVLRGRMGTGKTKAGEVFGSLIEDHYYPVDEPRYITGQFNAHMASCLLLQAEEAVWAGDKAAEGRLKSLITSKQQMIEAKGIDPVRIANYVRLIMTSNDDWVVPAGMDERRFAVFDVGDHVAGNFEYFREMDAELAQGGREALLADLLEFDLGTVELREIPKTDALLEQKIRSLPSVESWWFGRLNSGLTTGKASTWLDEVPKSTLVDDYIDTSERIGVRRKAAETELGLKLAKMVPGLQEQRKFIDFSAGDTRRAWVWLMPPLAECRAAFEAALQQPVGWSVIDDVERAGSEG